MAELPPVDPVVVTTDTKTGERKAALSAGSFSADIKQTDRRSVITTADEFAHGNLVDIEIRGFPGIAGWGNIRAIDSEHNTFFAHSLKVALAVHNATERAFADKELSESEARALTALAESVSVAIKDKNFSSSEETDIAAQAAKIAPSPAPGSKKGKTR